MPIGGVALHKKCFTVFYECPVFLYNTFQFRSVPMSGMQLVRISSTNMMSNAVMQMYGLLSLYLILYELPKQEVVHDEIW